MKLDKKLFEKNETSKTINKINKIMDSIKEVEDTMQIVSETLVICGGEVIDKKTFSIMSLPSTEEVFEDLD